MSVATSISPNELLKCDPAIYAAMKFILQEQAQARNKPRSMKGRR